MSTPNQITMPTLAPDATLKLTDPRPTADATFTTKKGRPVDAVCVDHAVVETGKGTPAVRLLFVILNGQNEQDADVKGHNIVTDQYLSGNAAPYTFDRLILMGIKATDEKGVAIAPLLPSGDYNPAFVAKVLELLEAGDATKSGLGGKVMRVSLKTDSFNGQDVVRVGDISQPPQKLEGGQSKKLLTSVLAGLNKGKPEKAEGVSSGARPPRNPTSPPPARDGLAPNPATDGDMTF